MLPNHLQMVNISPTPRKKGYVATTDCRSVPLKKSTSGMFDGDKALCFSDFPGEATREESEIF